MNGSECWPVGVKVMFLLLDGTTLGLSSTCIAGPDAIVQRKRGREANKAHLGGHLVYVNFEWEKGGRIRPRANSWANSRPVAIFSDSSLPLMHLFLPSITVMTPLYLLSSAVSVSRLDVWAPNNHPFGSFFLSFFLLEQSHQHIIRCLKFKMRARCEVALSQERNRSRRMHWTRTFKLRPVISLFCIVNTRASLHGTEVA